MKKLIAIYRTPSDTDAFLIHYREKHLPLASKIPGLIRTEVTRIERTIMGEAGNFLLAEMYFADADSFRTAMKSPENVAAGADLANFAEGLVMIMTGEVMED